MLTLYNADLSAQDSEGNQALHYAALSGHLKACALLIQHRASVDAQSSEDHK